jgi:hypothetical protein
VHELVFDEQKVTVNTDDLAAPLSAALLPDGVFHLDLSSVTIRGHSLPLLIKLC